MFVFDSCQLFAVGFISTLSNYLLKICCYDEQIKTFADGDFSFAWV